MKIVEIEVKKLIPYVRNQKKHTEEQIKKIMSSIKEFGFKQPVIVDKENVIVVGHGRVLASERLGIEKVPCVVADDLTEAQIKAYRIADNKLNESEWDMEMLAVDIQEIIDLGLEAELTGFESEDIEDLLKEKENINLDDFFEENTKPKEKEKKVLICPHCGEEIEV